MHFFFRLPAVLNRGIEYTLVAIGLSMTLTVVLQVIFRYIFNNSLFWSEELARYMLVWISFLGATVAYHRGSHPSIDLLTSALPSGLQHKVKIMANLIALTFFSIMTISGAQFSWFVRLQITPALGIAKWIVLLVLPISGTLLFFYTLVALIKQLVGEPNDQ